MAFFSCLITAMLCAFEHKKAAWNCGGNNAGEEWMHMERTLLLPEHTSHPTLSEYCWISLLLFPADVNIWEKGEEAFPLWKPEGRTSAV